MKTPSHADLPVYLVGYRDRLVGTRDDPGLAIPSFGTPEDALVFLEAAAKEKGVPASEFTVLEYRYAGAAKGE